MTASPAPAPPWTVGVEEEYHLVDATSLELADAPEVVALAEDELGPTAQAEISTTQLEIATPVCGSLDDVRRELARARAGAARAAERAGCHVLVAATHPVDGWQRQRLRPEVRYLELFQRWGILALQQGITGCHVHVGVPDRDTAVAVMDRVRPYLAVLRALSGSSPYWEGTDTGYDSYRTQWFDRWPVTGVPDALGDAAAYDALVGRLAATGMVHDASHLYWDVRPSVRYPTIEFRVADVCTELDDAVLQAALARSLTRCLVAHAEEGRPVPDVPGALLRAARWLAARHGVSGDLLDPRSATPRPAPVVVADLLADLRPDLEEHGEYAEVAALVAQVLGRGTSARRQRAVLARSGGDLDAVTRWLVATGVPR